ncbi:MAG: DUF2797 domain-containing protein [Candidatus Hodarchaeales archaeon]
MRERPYYLKLNWEVKEYKPFIRIYDPLVESIINIPVLQQLNIATGDKRYCTGHRNIEGRHVSCPDDEMIDKGRSRSTCSNCFQRDPFTCRATCKGISCNPSSDLVKAVCDKGETCVYITLIGRNLKVGVSSNPVRRWLGQGSDYSIIIWKGDGLIARKIEKYISNKHGLAAALNYNRKIASLREIVDEKTAKKILEQLRTTIIDEDNLPPSKEYDRSVYNLLDHYGPSVKALKNVTPFIQDISNQTLLKGEVAVIKGSLLVLKENRTYRSYNLDHLKGWEVLAPDELDKKQLKPVSLLDFA